MNRGRSRPILSIVLFSLALTASGCRGGWWPKPQAEALSAGPNVPSPLERIEALEEIASEHDSRAGEDPAWEQEKADEIAAQIRNEDNPLIRAQMLRTLAPFKTPTAEFILTSGLKDGDPDVRMACCEAWRRRGGPEAVRVLSDVLKEDTELDVRLAAARELGQLDDPVAMQSLAMALEDENPAMQYRAMRSLESITGESFGNDVLQWREYAASQANPSQPAAIAGENRPWF
jgi:HEAT repeat protein